MTVWVVYSEWNRPWDVDGAANLEGVAASETGARRIRWAAMRQYIGFGHKVYGRRHDEEWSVDVHVERVEVQP